MPEGGADENTNNIEIRTKNPVLQCPVVLVMAVEVPAGASLKTASHGAVREVTLSLNAWCVAGLTASCRWVQPDGGTVRSTMPTRTPTSDRHLHRLALGAAALLSVAQAVALLPMNDREARRWLRHHGLIHDLEGREVVVWGEVLAAVTKQDEVPSTPTTTSASTPVLRRAKLEPIR